MSRLADTILHELESAGGNRKLTVGVLFQGHSPVVQRIAAAGHRTIVIGERFRILYRVYKKTEKANSTKPLMLEAHFDALPIRPGSLDALVLSQGLPSAELPGEALVQLRSYLKDSGLLIWLHQVTDGIGGTFGRLFFPYRGGTFRAVSRDRLCTLTMASGFSEIGQTLLIRKLIPWAITTGLAAQRPWEKASAKNL
jgi:hypothetical protein